jgi:hypothetical protein
VNEKNSRAEVKEKEKKRLYRKDQTKQALEMSSGEDISFLKTSKITQN